MPKQLVRFFESESHQKQFMEGKLYCNLLARFRELGKRNIRYDTHEGAWRLPHDLDRSYEYLDYEMNVYDVRLIPEWTNHINLICMSIIDIPLGQGDISIPGQMSNFGFYGVIINNYGKFRTRVYNAVTSMGDDYAMGGGAVKYSNDRVGIRPALDTMLHKREKYSHEREHRIVIFTGNKQHDPLIINIGSIEDIATPIHKIPHGY